MIKAALGLFVLLSMACGGTSPTPGPLAPTPPPAPAPTPTPTPTPPPPPPMPIVLSGRVTATNGGRSLEDINVAFGGLSALTDLSGAFRLEWAPGTASMTGPVTLSGRQIVTRTAVLSVTGSRDVALDAIFTPDEFDLNYYRQLVRNGLETPAALRSLRRWTQAPKIYLKVADEAGQPIDAVTLDTVQAALGNDTGAFTGDRLGLALIDRGLQSQEGASGWITVKWANPVVPGICGRAQVAVDGGWIELNYLNPNCRCGNSRMGSATVRHEMGHALGFYHTDGGTGDLMFNTIRTCTASVSKRERLHAAIAYSRPVGNVDPDRDPDNAISLRAEPIVVLP